MSDVEIVVLWSDVLVWLLVLASLAGGYLALSGPHRHEPPPPVPVWRRELRWRRLTVLMLAIAGALREHGLRDDQIKFELFASSQPGRARARAA